MHSTDWHTLRKSTACGAESAALSGASCDDHAERATGQGRRRLHRLRTVREREQVSRRAVARQLGVSVGEVERQEDETRDIVLSQLLRWQEVLNVPLADLLLDPSDSLSPPIRERAALLRSMKTAKLILKLASGDRVVRLAKMLTDQLTALMPELRNVSSWPTQGNQRTNEDYGIVFDRRLPDDIFPGTGE